MTDTLLQQASPGMHEEDESGPSASFDQREAVDEAEKSRWS